MADIREGESDEVAAAGPVCLPPFPCFYRCVSLSTLFIRVFLHDFNVYFIHVYFYMISMCMEEEEVDGGHPGGRER